MPRFDPHPDRRPAVVTGGSSGIGAAAARALAAAGHPVVLGARRLERCEAVAKEIEAAGGEAAAAYLDVADPGAVEAFVSAAEKTVGPIEVLVCNAGETMMGSGATMDPEVFARQIETNLTGAQRMIAALVPKMLARGRGDAVVISSDAVDSPYPGMAAYVAAKWGLEGLARTMQRELEGTGVRVSIVKPGPTLTEMGSRWDPARVPEVLQGLKYWGTLRHSGLLKPEQVAHAIVDVISMPRGSHITLVEIQPEAPKQREDEQ